MKKAIYLVRHAEPRIENGKKQGLTKEGRSQAARAAKTLAAELGSKSSVSIHHSPVTRCQETAHIIGEQLGLPIKEAPLRLKNGDNLAIRDTQSKLSQYLAHYEHLGVESPEAFTKRILRYTRRQQSDTLILIGNEVPLRLLLQYIAKTGYTITIKHGGCHKIIIDGTTSMVSEIR